MLVYAVEYSIVALSVSAVALLCINKLSGCTPSSSEYSQLTITFSFAVRKPRRFILAEFPLKDG